MASERRLRIKTLVLVLAMVVCANAGDLMLKRGMSQNGAVQLTGAGVAHAFRLTVTNGTIWVGIFFLTGFLVFYMTVLSWADYSYVMPAGAFGYALVTLLAVLFLGETVTTRRWFGVVHSGRFDGRDCHHAWDEISRGTGSAEAAVRPALSRKGGAQWVVLDRRA